MEYMFQERFSRVRVVWEIELRGYEGLESMGNICGRQGRSGVCGIQGLT